MGRYRCPSCATVVEAEDPTRLVCPTCGFGDPARLTGSGAAPPPSPAPAAPPSQYNPYQANPPGGGSYSYQPPAPTGYAYQPGQAQAPLQTPGQSVAALVFGLIAIFANCLLFIPFLGAGLGFLSGIAAIILGTLGIKEANKDPQRVGGKGMAITGLVLGIISLSLAVIAFFLMLFVAAVFTGF